MLFIGILGFVIGFGLLVLAKKHEMENKTDAGVVVEKSVMSGFGWHLIRVFGGLLTVVGFIVAIFGYLSIQ
ncbi:MAG: hypothetical protein ABJ387_00095 [Balneola sp.]